ncbi:hypothetical protein GQ43DRAFT_174459 [Delitschia confertaspora ATCC 74209]|uniref:Uncharacterized protein n=1 Tax=Delitschia confertaspora ATCC 74209 TaxID=1513339 RepID=A0A9P4JK31_9PLEO|nr:hypothetical protein GQ43DRAFT_174459 [Delitschia confertaspora ATCC 74209]
MGNSQSHHKLSKPKTNTNSPFASPKVDKAAKVEPLSVSSRYSDFRATETPSRPNGKRDFRTLLSSPVETDFSFPPDENDDIGELASHVQRRLSTLSTSASPRSPIASAQTSTTKLASLPSSKLSVTRNSLEVEYDTAVKILQEVRKNSSREDLASLHTALQPSGRAQSLTTSQGLNRRLSTANSSSPSLIRRRSLATPGLATRNSPIDTLRNSWAQWSSSPRQSKKQEWKIDMTGTSPLTKLSTLDVAEESRNSPTPRAKTPGDMDYAHLGSLKIGSLYVTNGAPSPSASVISKLAARRPSNQESAQEDDYFTASGGYKSPVACMQPRKSKGHGRSKSSALLGQNKVVRNQGPNRRAKTMSRCDSPLKVERRPHTRCSFETTHSEQLERRLHVVNKSADTLARDYRAEIAPSPFATEEDAIQIHTAQEAEEGGPVDEGFIDSMPDDGVSFREEAFRILDGTIFGDDTPLPQSIGGIESSDRPPAPSKADSGYSSGGSFLSGRHSEDASKDGSAPVLHKHATRLDDLQESGSEPVKKHPISSYTFKEMLSLPISKPLPPVPIHESVAGRPAHLHLQEGPYRQLYSASAPFMPKSTASLSSTESKASTKKRLQKRTPSYQSLPVVQSCTPIAAGSIPDVPVPVREKFVRRLSETPGMEYLTQTYISAAHTDSNESLINSPSTVPITFPSPPSSPAPPRHHLRAQTERPPTPPSSLRRSLSIFRGKMGEEKKLQNARDEEEKRLTVIELGTVASSLGGSPYDIATNIAISKSNVPVNPMTLPTHPHQLGSALPRARSMVNMEAKVAADFARMRSKDRALARPQMPARPRSYYGSSQSYILYNDVPPMPTTEIDRLPAIRDFSPNALEENTGLPKKTGPTIRAKPTGRGPVVNQMIDRYDKQGQKIVQTKQKGWEAHSRLWSQRRQPIAEGLQGQSAVSPSTPTKVAERGSSEPPEDVGLDRYTGSLTYGYEGASGVGGGAGTRQLHSSASRNN